METPPTLGPHIEDEEDGCVCLPAGGSPLALYMDWMASIDSSSMAVPAFSLELLRPILTEPQSERLLGRPASGGGIT